MSNSFVRIPPEWAPQSAIWTAWPANPAEWNGDLETPRQDVGRLVHALAEDNQVRLLVNGSEALESARLAVGDSADLLPAKYGDIWLRDTGPVFAHAPEGPIALRFRTNGWGGKFDLPDDATVGDEIAQYAGKPVRRYDFVLEGGAVDHDGKGTFLATRQTLLHPNRNGWSKDEAETALREAMGARKVIWIDEGLKNDHTDGHIDNIARFVGEARVVCQAPSGSEDPNGKTLDAIARVLEQETDADGRALEVIRVPGTGRYVDPAGDVAPASHMNFVIANGVVAVPIYETATQDSAIEVLSDVFAGRRVVGIPSRGLLGSGGAGGGSFHCITQQEPSI